MAGDLYSAGASFLGDVLGFVSAQQQLGQAAGFSQQQIALQRELAARNEQLQRDFAQQGIRWRVADAKAAGLHPLAAIGAAGASYTPSAFVPGDNPYSSGGGSEYLSRMGQDVGRAIAATQTKEERLSTGHELTMMKHREDGAMLDNQIKAAQLAKLTQSQIGPPMAGGSGADGGAVVVRSPGLGTYESKPAEVGTANPERANIAAGPSPPTTQFYRLGDNMLYAVPTKFTDDMDIANPVAWPWYVKEWFSGSRVPQAVLQSNWPGASGYYRFGPIYYPRYGDEPHWTRGRGVPSRGDYYAP